MTKLRIWVVDDVDNQREMVIAALIPTSVALSTELRAQVAKKIFNITEFSSAKKAEEALITNSAKDIPDLILSDNDFSTAFEKDPEDNREDRGLAFLEMIHEKFPGIHKILITSFSVNPYLERFFLLQRGKALLTLFAIDRDKISNEDRLNQWVRDIARYKLYLLDEEGKTHLSELYSNVSSIVEFGDKNVAVAVIEDRTYRLDSLLAPWIKIADFEQGNGVIFEFDDEDFSEVANTLFSPFTPTTAQVFNGQLNTSNKQTDNKKKLELKNRVKQLLCADQSKWIEQLIPEISNALSIFFTFCPNWLSVQGEKHLSVSFQNTILQQTYNPKDLAALRNHCLNSNLKLSIDHDDAQLEENWLNILRSRLVILGIFALKQRGPFFQKLPFAIDFAIQVVLRNNPKSFLWRLYHECPDLATIPIITEELAITGKKGDATSIQFFNTFCGLAGGITHRVQVDKNQHYFREEIINQDCLFPGERKWMLDIKKGNLLKDL